MINDLLSNFLLDSDQRMKLSLLPLFHLRFDSSDLSLNHPKFQTVAFILPERVEVELRLPLLSAPALHSHSHFP